MRSGPWLALAAAAAVGLAAFTLEPRPPIHVVILHTNDMHGQALPLVSKTGEARGGFAALAKAIERERADARAHGWEPVLVDAGDLWVGPPEGTRTEGAFVVSVMDRLGYDVAEVGNHELDRGPAKLAWLTTLARFPFVGANIRDEKTHRVPPWLHEDAIVRRSGASLRFIGLLTSSIKEVTVEGATKGLEVLDEERAVSEALARGAADVTILLSHCGDDVDGVLAERFAGWIQVIVGGHTHKALDPAPRVPARNPVLIVQTGARVQNLGRIDLELEGSTHRILHSEERLVPLLLDRGEDPEMRALVDAEAKKCDEMFAVKVGSIDEPLVRDPHHAPSNLGSLICDVLRAAAGTDLAFTNPRGLRADIPKGDVLFRNLCEVDPFENTVVTMSFTGSELRELLEEMCQVEPLECSGLELRYDSRRPAGSRIASVRIGGADLDAARSYTLATNNFLAGGGDKYAHFKLGHQVARRPEKIRDLVRAHFEKVGAVRPPPYLDRIVDEAKER